MGLTVSHASSVTNADNPLYAIKPSDWNSSHIFTLNAAGSEVSGAFGNGGGVTFGLSADGKVTAAAPAGAPSPVNFSAGTTSNNLASVVFSNSGGISFGLNGSTITGTVATNYQSQGAYLTTAMQSNAATISNINLSAGTTSNNLSAFVLSNSNNFSFGLNGSTVTASYTVPTVTNSSWTVSDTATSATVGRLAFTAANGITMTLSTSNNGNHTVFASYTVPTVTNSSWTVSDTATSATVGRLAFTAANGITMTLSTSNNGNHTVFASYTVPTVSGHGIGVSNTGNTAGNTGTQSTGTVVFAGSGAITASQSTGAGISTIWYSVAAQSNQSAIKGFGASNTGNTAGNTGISSGIDWVIAGTNNITVSESTVAGGPNTIWLSAPSPGAGIAAGISNTGNTAGNTGTVSSGTVVFAASGAITASQSTAAGQSTVWYSVAAQTNQSAIKGLGVSNTGNTLGNTGLSTGIDWVIAGSGAITASQSTAGGGPDTIWMSVASQTNQTVGLYALGNTTQNSSTTLDARTMSFNGLGAATWGYSNGSIQVSVPATSSIVGTSGISISTAGSTISVYPKPLSAWDPYPIISGTAVSSHAPASFWFSRMILDWDVAVSYANILKSLNVSAPGMSSQNSSLTNKFSYSHGLTLFTRQDFAGNSSNMSQWTTASFGMTGSLSQSSSSASVALSWVTNSTGGSTSFSTTSSNNSWTNFFTGMQMFRIPLVTTLTPGEYFIGQAHSSTTATVGSNFTLLSVSNLHVAPASNTFATITSSGSLAFSSPDGAGVGIASAVTTNNTMAMSVVSANTQNWWYMNFSNI